VSKGATPLYLSKIEGRGSAGEIQYRPSIIQEKEERIVQTEEEKDQTGKND
jgi:hypothetical protein